MMTEFEAGVRELVARLRDFERRMKKTEDDAGALEQYVKLIAPGLGFDTPSGTNTTISGTVKGCGPLGWPNDATVVIRDASTLAVLDTVTVDSAGIYTSNIFLSATATCTVTATITGTYAARFSATSITSAITAGAANTGRDVTVAASSGYLCYLGCQFPIPKALTMIDSVIGTFTTTNWGTTNAVGSYNFPASPACVARTAVGMAWQLNPSATTTIAYHSNGGPNDCPLGGPIVNGTVKTFGQTSLQCLPFLTTFTVSGLIYGGTVASPGTATITWKE